MMVVLVDMVILNSIIIFYLKLNSELHDDALKAIEQFNDVDFNGKKLHVSWAIPKEEKQIVHKKKPVLNSGVKLVERKDRGNILIVFNIKTQNDVDNIRSYCEKFDESIEIEYPYSLFSELDPVCLIKFKNNKIVKLVQKRLDNTEINSRIIQVRRLSAFATNQKERLNCRVIIHNLSFQAKEKDINDLFHFFGPIEEIYIPHKDSKHSKGFAFVQYMFDNDAKEAVKELNGKVIKVLFIIFRIEKLLLI